MRYWLLMEFLCGEFKNDTTEFTISHKALKRILHLNHDKKLLKFVQILTEFSAKFDQDLLEFSQDSNKFWSIKTPIILELMGKDFKKARVTSDKSPSKKEEERIKKEEERIIREIAKKAIVPVKTGRTANEKEKARQVKFKYIAAYKQRYNIEPIFSVKENKLVYNMLSKISFNESLDLVEKYILNYHDPWHVKQKHPFSLLISQLDKVRVELANPNRMLDHITANKQIQKEESNQEFNYEMEEMFSNHNLEQQQLEQENYEQSRI